MAMVNTQTFAPLHAQLKEVSETGALTPDRACEVVRAWLAENLPQLPAPAVHVRCFTDTDTGRLYARATITITPLCMDVLVSEAQD